MKILVLLLISSVLLPEVKNPQSSDEKTIRETIIGFSRAGDLNDVTKLSTFLDENYRIVMNQLFGSDAVMIMPREVYLEKIRTKEFGGDTRKVEFETVTLNGNTACVKVSFIGSKMTFVSLITLVKNKEQQWKLISEVPIAT